MGSKRLNTVYKKKGIDHKMGQYHEKIVPLNGQIVPLPLIG